MGAVNFLDNKTWDALRHVPKEQASYVSDHNFFIVQRLSWDWIVVSEKAKYDVYYENTVKHNLKFLNVGVLKRLDTKCNVVGNQKERDDEEGVVKHVPVQLALAVPLDYVPLKSLFLLDNLLFVQLVQHAKCLHDLDPHFDLGPVPNCSLRSG